jgi:hypothetical protein
MIRSIVRVLMLYIAFPYILKTTLIITKSSVKLTFFFIENIFVMFGGYIFQQTVSFPMWVPTVHFLPTCSFIHMQQTS